ncbi:MAG: hypothetical protein HY692_03805, partial [Cyanobacteria bacterium NC_groundwater_1444_Ag_S-0.65um_54_12]|nr:hypothetical protein [Cyanobacteria bacterium NC_groundwater_1444_Ag_S-0.65um_54_12]
MTIEETHLAATRLTTAVSLAAVLSLSCYQVSSAQEVAILEEIIPAPELGPWSAIDIGRLTWRVSGKDGEALAQTDFDDTNWVARAAVSPELLRNPVAWYRFRFLTAPGTAGLASRLDFGGIEGNVSVYLNGVWLGECKGETDPPYVQRQTITLPASLLGPEYNVLAFRLTSFPGRAQVGIPRGPIRLLPLSATYEHEDRARQVLRRADQLAAYLGGSNEQIADLARQAARARRMLAAGSAAKEVSKVLQPAVATLARVERSLAKSERLLTFGRFGRQHQEGLLTCTLSPTGFTGVKTIAVPQPLSGTFGRPGKLDLVALEYLSPIGKALRVEQETGSHFKLYYPLAYPGFAIEPREASCSVQLSVPSARQLTAMWIDRWGVVTSDIRRAVRPKWVEPWILFYDPLTPQPPLLLALPSPQYHVRLVPANDSLVIELPPGKLARFCWPSGITPGYSESYAQNLARFRSWASAMVPFGITQEDRVAGAMLQASDRFSYLPAGSLPYAPLPPILGLLLEAAKKSGKTSEKTYASAVSLTSVRAPGARDLAVPTLAG